MNTSSYFIPDKALFGSYPTSTSAKELEENGVCLFVNLTELSENLDPYNISPTSEIIHFPIPDRKIPINILDFSIFIISVTKKLAQLSDNKKIYIHCKGGHGRSGVVVASILCYYYDIEPSRALELTTQYHSNRKEMRAKWRTIGSPQTPKQKFFVTKLFEPLRFYKAFKTGNSVGFSNFSAHPVYIDNFGKTFPTAEAAFNAFKSPNDTKYIDNLVSAKTPFIAKELSRKCELREDWYERRQEFMTIVIYAKLLQHEDFRNNLLHSYLRPIVHYTQNDKYWGNGANDCGQNILGKILMKLRNKLYIDIINKS